MTTMRRVRIECSAADPERLVLSYTLHDLVSPHVVHPSIQPITFQEMPFFPFALKASETPGHVIP